MPTAGDYLDSVDEGQDGCLVIRDALRQGDPVLIARLGFCEARCLGYWMRWRDRATVPLPFPRIVRRDMHLNAGFFPADDEYLDRFAQRFGDAVSGSDVMGVWRAIEGEHQILKRYCPGARLVGAGAISEPAMLMYPEPWTAELASRTVLVVHPFAKSIEQQYRENRTKLFANPQVLPAFDLKTLKAVQSIAGSDSGYGTWFDALDHMCDQIAHIEYDTALIGAGAYGLPLAAFVKSQGKQAVHMGGLTQALFGIRGRRWETEYASTTAGLFNEHWVRPLPEETPERAGSIENGATGSRPAACRIPAALARRFGNAAMSAPCARQSG